MFDGARVLKTQDLEAIQDFEKSRITQLNDIEKTFLEWKAPWRKESLEHYLNTSWSMGLFEGESLKSYFLAQPFLFVESYTQTLWIEHLGFKEKKDLTELVDLIVKYAKDKHLQRVLFNQIQQLNELSAQFKFASTQKNYFEVFTTKLG